MKLAALLVLLLPSLGGADQVRWLDVVGYPAIPGWSERHIQVLHTLETDDSDTPEMLGRIQFATRLPTSEVQALHDALVAWLAEQVAPIPFWHSQHSASNTPAHESFTLEFYSAPTPERHVRVISTSLSWLDVPPVIRKRGKALCPTCYPSQVFDKQQMPLTTAEVEDFVAALAQWLGGDDMNGLVYSKFVQTP